LKRSARDFFFFFFARDTFFKLGTDQSIQMKAAPARGSLAAAWTPANSSMEHTLHIRNKSGLLLRVARFFLAQNTQTAKNVPNATKCTKWP
jgi:hypothetical protein